MNIRCYVTVRFIQHWFEMMGQDTQDKRSEIKGRFRLMMNGVVSQSMREKGVGYKINWGVSLPLLKNMADEYGKDYDLAIALWKEDIRECKILATLIMPAQKMSADLVDLWAGQINTQEIAEMLAYNLFQFVDGAKGFAFKWISSGDAVIQICGYNVLSRLFMRNIKLTERDINEFIDQTQAALSENNVSVQHTALNALKRFAQMDVEYSSILKSVIKSCDLGDF